MAKDSKKNDKKKSKKPGKPAKAISAKAAPPEKLDKKSYEQELKRLHVELVRLQQWVVHEGLKVCIVFEGRDGAGKGGTIKAITERVSPRVFRVVALPAPTVDGEIRIELQRAGTVIKLVWPAAAARDCAAWLRDWLR